VITIRYARPSDSDFVIDSFLQSYWNAAAVRGMTRDDYFSEMRPRLKKILAHSATVTKVACTEDDEDVLLGWSAHNGSNLLYVYVKKDMRGTGLARELVGTGIDGYMFRSGHATSVPKDWKYRPFLAWVLSA
jgi:GNAT superfamily N-acetyltransferase